MDNVPLINGTAHSWTSIIVNILGVPLAGITAIMYKDTEEKEDYHGIGRFVVGRGYGAITAEASITLTAETVLALEKVAPNGKIQDIPPFDIPVMYIPKNSSNIKKDIIRNAEFKENGRDAKTGDLKIEVEIPLLTSHVDFNA